MPIKSDIKKWDKYSMLTILKEISRTSQFRRFLCKCDCGELKQININNLTRTKSCWCLPKWQPKTHWLSHTRWYNIWNWINQRCWNKKHEAYHRYWWRWIKCEWNSIKEFYDDMKEWYSNELSIDRIDNNWNYSKNNCRWATRKQQSNNTRKSINPHIRKYIKYTRSSIIKSLSPWIEYDWIRLSVSEWCRRFWLNHSVVTSRVSVMWWTHREALWIDKRIDNNIWDIYWWCEIISNCDVKWYYNIKCFCGSIFTKKLISFKKNKRKHCWCLFFKRK